MTARIRSAARRSDERGSTTLELAIWAVPMLMLIGLLVVGGRIALAGNAVQSAAYAAAREATLARTVTQAQTLGDAAANFSLNSNGVNCISRSVLVDTSDFAQPLGQIGNVTATITCTVNLSDVGLTGIPGSTQLTATADSPVDPYRQR